MILGLSACVSWAIADCLRALALYQLGEWVDATIALHNAEVTALRAWPEPTGNGEAAYGGFDRFLPAHRLLSEAKSVIRSNGDDAAANEDAEVTPGVATESQPASQ